MDVISSGYSPNHFVLTKGVTVKWVITGKQVTSCNHRIVVPRLNLEFTSERGTQTIEFTPEQVGIIPWSCWMGMLHGDFEVVEAPRASKKSPQVAAETETPRPETSSQPVVAPPAPTPASRALYTVVAGDTLRSIAKKHLGEIGRWRDIRAQNSDLDPRRLRPGQILKLP